MLCLQQQLDLVTHLAQPLLNLPASRGMAEKLPQGLDQNGISYRFFFPVSDAEGCAGYGDELADRLLTTNISSCKQAQEIFPCLWLHRGCQALGMIMQHLRHPILVPTGGFGAILYSRGLTDPHEGGNNPNQATGTSSFRVSC